MKNQNSDIQYIVQSIKLNWDKPAFSNYDADTYKYSEVAQEIEKQHLLFEAAGIRPGDKIALCGLNSSQWAIALLATLTYGATAVPILNDFKADTITHLVDDSDSRILFTNDRIWRQLNPESLHKLEMVMDLGDFRILYSRNKKAEEAHQNINKLFGEKYPESFTSDMVSYPVPDPDSIAIINYTAGSTGFSKGVMLPHRSIWSNLQFCIDGLTFLSPGDGVVAILPQAHMYGLMVETLHPFVKGCHTHFLQRTPSPTLLLDAMAKVKPKMVVAVPLIIEKIVKTRVFPVLHKPLMRVLLHMPFIAPRILAKVKSQLINAFGGQLLELIIGGAGVNAEVEQFLRKIKFPYTVGYGMTECGPLIGYAQWDIQRPGSCGRVVDRMEVRIDSPDPEHTPGVLSVRGDNVMTGYYHNDEATKAVLSADGWMNTGDICTIDADGYLYIRGRDKNMILGPSGQNIYPEEIEQVLNNLPMVAESLVVDDHGKLVALIHPDYDAARRENMDDAAIEALMKKNVATLNTHIPAFSQVRDFRIMKEEFEKTPKKSIKRFLYNP